jgi:hypothetical protein
MTDHTHAAKAARQHTVYKLASGKRVPGVTTITGVMDKPALKKWANRLGLQGIEVEKYVDELAVIGTLAHYMIECHCKNQKPDLGDYTPNQISLAENSYIKWMFWKDSVKFEPVHNELALVSEKHQFGGTLDIIGRLNGKLTLVDIKTCKGIFGEHKTQVAGGYKILADDNETVIGGKIEDIVICRVGRNEEEGFESIQVSPTESQLHQKRFLICKELYRVNQEIGR